MKNIWILITIMMLPTGVPAKTPMTDTALSVVTGQAGVSINVDMTMDISLGTMSWGDATGLDEPWDTTDADTGGYMGINNFSIDTLHIRSRTSDTYNGYDFATMWKPITIDVANDPLMNNGATFVRLGLGALEISWDSMEFEVALGPEGYNLDQKLGDVYLGELALYLNPASYIDIYNGRSSGETGLTMSWYSIVDRIDLSSVAWGDSDGLGSYTNEFMTTTSAGWVGLSNIIIGTTSVIGTFAIDIATTTDGIYSQLASGDVTVVHISFPTDFNLHTSTITAEVKLDSTPTLDSSNAGTLGNIYVSGFDLNILENSWVDLYAH